MSVRPLLLGCAVTALVVVPVSSGQGAKPRPLGVCPLPKSAGKLPPGALRGPANRLHQYAAPALATPAERAAARALLARLRTRTRAWRNPRAAAAAGFDTIRPRRRAGHRGVMWFHAEHRRWHADRHYLDARRPDTLIYADAPGRPLVLVGVMISMPRGLLGPSPGGPITRWHTHRVCSRAGRRGLAPRPDGSCPSGTVSLQGSEMMHLWFTRDLRSSYAIHAPVPELCTARLLPAASCSVSRRPS